MDEIKKEFRRCMRERIAALDANYLKESNNGIYEAVCELPEVRAAGRILAYCSIKNEVDTGRLISRWLDEGKEVALPVCLTKGKMYFTLLRAGEKLQANRFGILEPPADAQRVEPEEVDVIIVPALTYDLNGYRIGQGGGFYDRWLSANKVFSAGLAREQLVCPKVPIQTHDCRVNCLVTETGARYFQAK